jgi:hypothetical protein
MVTGHRPTAPTSHKRRGRSAPLEGRVTGRASPSPREGRRQSELSLEDLAAWERSKSRSSRPGARAPQDAETRELARRLERPRARANFLMGLEPPEQIGLRHSKPAGSPDAIAWQLALGYRGLDRPVVEADGPSGNPDREQRLEPFHAHSSSVTRGRSVNSTGGVWPLVCDRGVTSAPTRALEAACSPGGLDSGVAP